jgi:hypothetical protein
MLEFSTHNIFLLLRSCNNYQNYGYLPSGISDLSRLWLSCLDPLVFLVPMTFQLFGFSIFWHLYLILTVLCYAIYIFNYVICQPVKRRQINFRWSCQSHSKVVHRCFSLSCIIYMLEFSTHIIFLLLRSCNNYQNYGYLCQSHSKVVHRWTLRGFVLIITNISDLYKERHDFSIIWLFNLLTMNVPVKGYSRNVTSH